MNPCNIKPFLTAYVLGDLEPKKAQAIQTHLVSCPECRDQVEALQKTLSLLKEAFPAERLVTDKGPVLEPSRRMKLLSIKPVVKQNRFMHFIEVAYRPMRSIAATLLCVFGILGILSAAFFPAISGAKKEKYSIPKGQGMPVVKLERKIVNSLDVDYDGVTPQPETEPAPATTPDVAGWENKPEEKMAIRYGGVGALKKSKSRALEVQKDAVHATESGTERVTADQFVVGDRSEAPQGPTRGYVLPPQKQEAQSRIVGATSELRRDRYDDGLEVQPVVPAPTTSAPEPPPLDAVLIVKSPAILKNVYSSRSSGAKGKSVSGRSGKMGAGSISNKRLDDVDMDGNVDIFADTPVLTESAAAPAKPVSKAGAAGGAYYYREATEAAKDVQTEMETLKIAVPKPTFTGTPKDIRSENLEEPGARRGQVVHVSEEVSSSTLSYSAQPSQKPGAVVNGTTTVSGGTLFLSGKAKEDRTKWVSDKEILARAKHEEEARFRQVDKKADADKTVDTSRLISDHLKKNLENNIRDEGYVSNAPKWGDVGGQIIAGNDMSRRNEEGEKKQLVDQKKLALDLPRKPSRPSEPLPFNSFVLAATEAFSTFAMDVDTASYTLTRQSLRSGKLPDPERVRLEEIVNAFDYGDKAPEKATFRIYQDGAQSSFGAGYNLLRIGVKGKRLGREEQRPAILTMVLDVSGSMSQPDRIGFARLSLSSLLDQMGADDRIQLIAYSDQAQFVLEPTPAKEKKRIMAAFDRLQCNGSTNLEEGMLRAYEQAVQAFVPGAENRVILISDGVANLGADSAQDILNKVAANRKQGITCSVFGVGSGTYNDKILQELANKGDGVYRFLDSAEEVKTAFVDDLAATLNYIAKDAKIQVEWNPKTVRRYRQMGYEKRKLTKEQFRDDTVDAGEVGSGQSVTALYELELMPDVTSESTLGTVRIRYQRVDNGKVEEIEATLVASTVMGPAHKATPSFKVAAAAAEFAELLRGSPNAQGGNFDAVADYLRPAALERTLDTRVKELLELVTTANALTK